MGKTSGKAFWNKVKHITEHRSKTITQPLQNQSGELSWDDKSILNILVDKHINRSVISRNYSFDDNFYNKINSLNNKFLDSEGHNPEILDRSIPSKEIEEAISNINGLGSPGPPSEGITSPGIPPLILKLASIEISPFLKTLFDIL